MALRGDLYSRLIWWLKVLLPLIALVLLSSVFVISRKADLTGPVRIAPGELSEKARAQGVTNPSFASTTERGDQLYFYAAAAGPDPAEAGTIDGQDVAARLRLVSGAVIDVTADRGQFRTGAALAELAGAVRVLTTQGYDIQTEQLQVATDRLHAESPGPVSAEGPPGRLDAGAMLLRPDPESGQAELNFTKGVKLIYYPRGQGG